MFPFNNIVQNESSADSVVHFDFQNGGTSKMNITRTDTAGVNLQIRDDLAQQYSDV
jgi:hypothetical protein